jgi:general secretion pathway protein D
MSDFAKGSVAVFFSVILLASSLIASENTTAIAFDPFGSNERDDVSSTSDAVDQGPVIPQIQFTNNDISDAFQIISDATGWSIFPTAEVSRAKVSLWAKDITAKELLDTVVTLAGFIYHHERGVISVMTYDEYMQYYGLAKKVVAFAYADASAVAAVIKQFLTKLGKSVVHKETNTIVLYEADANLEFITGIIEKLDTPAEDIGIEVINLEYADCDSLATVLNQAFAQQKRITKHKGSESPRTAAPAGDKATRITRTTSTKDTLVTYDEVGIYAARHANQLIVVGTKAEVQKVKDTVAMLDVQGDNIVLEVIGLKYADAEMVGRTLQEVFSSRDSGDNIQSSQKGRKPLKQLSPQAAAESGTEIKGMLLTPQTHIEVYSVGRTNQLIVKAFRNDIEKLKTLVEKLDFFIEPTTRTYHFVYVDAAEVYRGLEQILDIYSRRGRSYTGSGRGSGQTSGGGYDKESGLTLVERTNSILLTGPPSAHRIMASICKSVDAPGMYETGMIRVYKIENADVDEIATTVNELLTSQEDQRGKPGEPTFEEPTAAAPQPGSREMAETEEFVPQAQARVSVNKATNSIVVLATARQHRELEKLIEELDVRRKQVLIKAVIIEVTTSDDLDLGVELDYFEGDVLAFTSFGLSTIDTTTGVRDIIVSPGGTGAVLRPNKVQAILKALQSNGNVRIESAPQILVNDNAVGTIVSIAEEPTTQTNLGETTTTTSFAGFVEAGTQFAITPHISESDYLRVTYRITLNSFGTKPTDPSIPPPRNTSSIESEATVPDGSTIVVGGLQSVSESESVDKVPILGDLPLLDLVFRNTIIRKQYITTYLFITTTILKSQDFADLKDISQKALEEVKDGADKQTPDTAVK